MRNILGIFALAAGFAAGGESAFATTYTTETAPLGAKRVAAPAAIPGVAGGGAEALRTALLSTGEGAEGARSFYENYGYVRLWFGVGGDVSRAEALIAALEDAPSHALPAGRYPVAALRAALAAGRAGDPSATAAAELAFTRTYLKYARDVGWGVLKPRAIDKDLHVFPQPLPDEALLARLAAAPDAAAHFASLAPSHPEYESLRALMPRMAALEREGAWGPKVGAGESLRLGDRGPRVQRLRARLAAHGDLGDAAPADPALFDIGLELALKTFQLRHGLNDDGVAGAKTVEALDADPAYRAGQIAVNLERLRWMNRDLGARHIIVNQADFRVKLVDDGVTLFHERVVVGKARLHRTPEFSDEMTYLVFNPTWNVPYSIASKEILPKLKEDPEYLAKNNMALKVRGEAGELDGTMTDWSLYSANDFPFLVRQRPGDGNALGKVKFMFPNQFNIYLHDTPSKRLFSKDVRAFSHGCVRVQDPMALARALLAPQDPNPDATISRLLDRGRETRVNLDQPVPVHLTYRTAWVDEAGARHFRADVYGRDARILAALRAAGVGESPEG